jgi:hypothetical protein
MLRLVHSDKTQLIQCLLNMITIETKDHQATLTMAVFYFCLFVVFFFQEVKICKEKKL